MKADPELSKCPCCGSSATFGYESGSWGYYEARHWVVCMNCRLSTDYVRTDDTHQGREKAAVLWNSRVGVTANA